MARLGWPPAWAKWGADERPDQKSGVERRIWKFIKGASPGEPSLAGFGGVVFQGEAKAGKSWRQGGATGRNREHAGAAMSCLAG
jgi:hypothetical protein